MALEESSQRMALVWQRNTYLCGKGFDLKVDEMVTVTQIGIHCLSWNTCHTSPHVLHITVIVV